jgi:hypothetical protein
MTKHLMLDLETLSVAPDAVILTLGAVHFDPYSTGIINELYIRINLEDQELLNRSTDPSTLEWWAKQKPEIIEEAFNPDNRIKLVSAVDQFHKFAWGCNKFWSHGAVFDLMIMENLYRQLKKPFPWKFWDIRDTRTLFDIGLDPAMPKEAKHNALEDARRQAIGVQNVYQQLKDKISS